MSAQELFRLETGPHDDKRIFLISFHGQHTMLRTKNHSNPVLDEILKDGYKTILFDYSDAVFGHSVSDFTDIANAWCERLPKGMAIGYIFAPASMTHAMLMSRLLNERGMVAGAFPDQEKALIFLKGHLGPSQ